MQPIQPEYRDRAKRVEVLDRQGVELAWLLPSLGLGLEEMLLDDTDELYAIFRAYNDWLHEDWGYDRDGRLQTGPMISLMDPAEAEVDMQTAIDRGAPFIVMRPAPVDVPGKPRSPGDPVHDRVWAMAAEAGVVVALHAADSGYAKYVQAWGEGKRYQGLKVSTFSEVLQVHLERPIFDTMAAFVCHGVFDRHPKLEDRLARAGCRLGARARPPVQGLVREDAAGVRHRSGGVVPRTRVGGAVLRGRHGPCPRGPAGRADPARVPTSRIPRASASPGRGSRSSRCSTTTSCGWCCGTT